MVALCTTVVSMTSGASPGRETVTGTRTLVTLITGLATVTTVVKAGAVVITVVLIAITQDQIQIAMLLNATHGGPNLVEAAAPTAVERRGATSDRFPSCVEGSCEEPGLICNGSANTKTSPQEFVPKR